MKVISRSDPLTSRVEGLLLISDKDTSAEDIFLTRLKEAVEQASTINIKSHTKTHSFDFSDMSYKQEKLLLLQEMENEWKAALEFRDCHNNEPFKIEAHEKLNVWLNPLNIWEVEICGRSFMLRKASEEEIEIMGAFRTLSSLNNRKSDG